MDIQFFIDCTYKLKNLKKPDRFVGISSFVCTIKKEEEEKKGKYISLDKFFDKNLGNS